MPAIMPRPGRPSFYPDWSTLVYAFAGLGFNAPPGRRELLSLIHDVARDANLCLSFGHLFELLKGTKRDVRLERARWLDQLDVVWLLDQDECLKLELEHLLQKSAGLSVARVGLPAAPSLLSSIRTWKPSQIPDVILDGTISRLIDAVGDAEKIRKNINSFSALGPYFNPTFRTSRG